VAETAPAAAVADPDAGADTDAGAGAGAGAGGLGFGFAVARGLGVVGASSLASMPSGAGAIDTLTSSSGDCLSWKFSLSAML
jgi:hypothetical protein